MTERLEEGWRDDIAAGHLHDVDDAQHAVAVDFPHEVVDSYRTDWARGCWDDGFRQQLPVMVWNHDPNILIGAGVRTESLGDRSRVIGRFANFAKVPKAEEVHSLLEDKIVPGWSFHYREGRTVPHPTQRGARRFVKARMLEFCPVTFPSIPGAVTAGIRAEEATLEVPTIDEIIRLKDQRVIDEDGMRALIAEHHPHLREHIKVAAPVEPTPAEKAAALLADSGLRDMVIRIGSDGTVSTGDNTGSDGGDDDDDPATLASAVDAALDEACNLFGTVDVTTLPDEVQQGIALAQAAGVAIDELLDVMGVADPDDGSADGDRAAMTAEDEKKLSDDDFAYIDSKGGRHLPIQDPPHVRNALARFDQTHFESDDAKAKAKAKIEAAAKKFGIDTSGSGKRSEPAGEPALTADLDRVLEKLHCR